MYWLVWTDGMGNTYADSFESEPTDDDIQASWTTGYYEVGEVQAETKEEAIELAYKNREESL